MAIDQFSNVVTMAAALTMVSWVTRSPDEVPYFQPVNNEIDYFGHLQQHWLHNQDDQLTESSPQLQTVSVLYDVDNNFQQLKFVSEFTDLGELRNLVSWEEAYRRGDLSFFRTEPNSYAYPLQQYNEIHSEYYQDDGYDSGDIASPSAASDISSLFSLDSPTASHLLDLSDLGVADLFNTDPGASNGNEASSTSSNETLANIAAEYPTTLPGDDELDLDQLFGDDMYDLYDSVPPTEVEPSNPATSSASYPDFTSPFLERHLDDYLGAFTQSDEQNNLDDPFRMQFTEPSNSLNELLTGFDCLPYSTVVDSDITSPYENNLENNIIEGQAGSMGSIEGSSQNSYAGPSSLGVFSTKSVNVAEHDYAKEFKGEEDVSPPLTQQIDLEMHKVIDTLTHTFYKNQRDAGQNKMEDEPKEASVSALETSRTFAPSVRKASSKRMKQGNTMVFPELPYTKEELVAMDIDGFNRVIERLDYHKQTFLKDIRKKGKNKFAARNCRKRKMDVLEGLDTNVENLEKQREMLLHEQKLLLEETRQIHEKTAWLSDYILQHLHDESGNPYSESYTLEYTTDGNVYLVPSLVKTKGNVAQDV